MAKVIFPKFFKFYISPLFTFFFFSYRFPDYFPHSDLVREVQVELDKIIQEGVSNIVQLLKNSMKVPGDSLSVPVSPEKIDINSTLRDLFIDDDSGEGEIEVGKKSSFSEGKNKNAFQFFHAQV